MQEFGGVAQKFSFEKSIVDPKVKRFCEVNCQHAIQGFFEILGDREVDPPFRIATTNIHIRKFLCGHKDISLTISLKNFFTIMIGWLIIHLGLLTTHV